MKTLLDKIVNLTHDAMIAVDMHNNIVLFNHSAERLLHLKREDVLGTNVMDVVENSRLPIVATSGHPELNQRQKLKNIEIITSRLPILDEGKIVGAVAIFRDISEMHKLAEEITDLKSVKQTLESIVRSAQDAISVVDKHGIHIIINPAYTRLTGYTERDVIGRNCNIDHRGEDSVHRRVLESGKPIQDVVVHSSKTKNDLIVSAAPIMVDGRVDGSVAILHDVSELNKLNKALAEAKQIIRNLEAKYTFDDIKGKCLNIKDAIEKAHIAAQTPATVILRGESGTGKELFAHAIHNASERKYSQFVRVNCAAISETLLESELFGYEEGAFTGASKGGRIGLFERASGGTIFLDEIGDIPKSTQLKLLRVLQEKEIVRVGSSQSIPVDVRIISATNANLEAAVKRGDFREDLYYRLNVIPIVVPALRDRIDDIPLLCEHIITKFNQEYGRNVDSISKDAVEMLKLNPWYGNVRELENTIGRVMILMRYSDTSIELRHLKLLDKQKMRTPIEPVDTDLDIVTLDEFTQRETAAYIASVLEQMGGNRTKTAKALGISVRSLYYKLDKLGFKNYAK